MQSLGAQLKSIDRSRELRFSLHIRPICDGNAASVTQRNSEKLEKIPRNFLRIIGGFERMLMNNKFQGPKLFIPSGLGITSIGPKNSCLAFKCIKYQMART